MLCCCFRVTEQKFSAFVLTLEWGESDYMKLSQLVCIMQNQNQIIDLILYALHLAGSVLHFLILAP